jgi:hypothetical protein
MEICINYQMTSSPTEGASNLIKWMTFDGHVAELELFFSALEW